MPQKRIINEYDKHLRQTIGVAESTRYQYTRYVLHFLSETGTDIFQDNRDTQLPHERAVG